MKAFLTAVALAFVLIPHGAWADAPESSPNCERLGWRLGVQAYSLNTLSFFETVDRVQSLGLRYVEAFPNQKLSPDSGNARFNHSLDAEWYPKILEKLESSGVSLVNYGVVPLPNDEAACRKVFEFAKALGVETLTSEPPDDALDLVDALAQEYEINVAMHNHPKPSENWAPAKVLAEVDGRSARLGACADTSHWLRSGVDVVDALKQLEGRILCFHLGDVDTAMRDAYLEHGDDPDDAVFAAMVKRIQRIPNVVFGQGAGDMQAWVEEIRRQKFEGVFSIEAFYAEKPDQAVESMRTSIAVFEELAASLGAE